MESSDASPERRPFPCQLCNKCFAAKETLDEHLAKCTEGEDETAFKCEASNKDPSDQKFRCAECPYSTNGKGNFKRHLITHSGERPHCCEVCNKTFARKSDLKTHLRIHTGERPYVCDTCGKGFFTSGNLRGHQKSHLCSPSKQCHKFHCAVCPYSTNIKVGYERHVLTHSGERPYRCETCNKGFTRKFHLQTHLRVHTGERPYVCDTCGMSFLSTKRLRYHQQSQSHKGEEEAPKFQCLQCPYSNNMEQNFKQHLLTHSGERPHRCKVCDKGFIRNVDLQTHLRLHTGERPFVCEICGKGFQSSNYLRCHQKTHFRNAEGDSEEFRCTRCPYSSEVKQDFRQHMLTHTRTHRCEICDKVYTRNIHLMTHLRLHTGERPYVCDTCGEGFPSSTHLRYHQKTRLHTDRSKEAPNFRCLECPYSNDEEQNFKEHLLTHSGEEQPLHC